MQGDTGTPHICHPLPGQTRQRNLIQVCTVLAGITHGAIPTHIATGQWAYIGKMPPKPQKLAATSGPGKPAGGATTRSSTATTTPGAASSKSPAPLPTPLSGASAMPEVKPTGTFAFLHKQPTYTPPPVYMPELPAAVTPKVSWQSYQYVN